MSTDYLDRLWNERLFDYDPDQPLDRQMPCAFAMTFQGWVDSLLEKHLPEADRLRINQLKLVVQDKYFELRTRLPEEHRKDDGRDPDHPCIFSVYTRTIGLLHERAIDLQPPELVDPASQRKPKRSIYSTLLGDEEES